MENSKKMAAQAKFLGKKSPHKGEGTKKLIFKIGREQNPPGTKSPTGGVWGCELAMKFTDILFPKMYAIKGK